MENLDHEQRMRSMIHYEQAIYDDQKREWLVSGFELARQLLQKSDVCRTKITKYPSAEKIRGKRGVQLLQGDTHQKLHKYIAGLFSSRELGILLPRLQELIRSSLSPLRSAAHTGEEVLFCNDVADSVSLKSISLLLGVQLNDPYIELYQRWTEALTDWTLTQGKDEDLCLKAEGAAELANQEMVKFLEMEIERNESSAAKLHRFCLGLRSDWSLSDTADQYRLLFLAGGEGVSQLMCTAVYKLITHAGATEASTAFLIEECLRRYPPAALRPLEVTQDFQIEEFTFHEGETIHLDIDRINLDPAIHEAPHEFNLSRPHFRHISFSMGSRVCIGAQLSRMIVGQVIDEIKVLMQEARMSVSGSAPVLQGYRFRGFRPLRLAVSGGALCQ